MKKIVVVFLLLLLTLGYAKQLHNCLYLNGDSSFVKLFEPIIEKQPFTIEAWFNTLGLGNGVDSSNVIFEQRSVYTGDGNVAIVLAPHNATPNQGRFEIRDNYSSRIKLACVMPPHFQWHHMVRVVDSEKVRLYVDGLLYSWTANYQNGNYSYETSNFSIGKHGFLDKVAGYFNGYIDEMRIWNYAKTSDQIQAEMFCEIDLNDQWTRDKLLAYWDFNDFHEFWKNGVQYVGVKDLSGNGHHGAFIDNATLVEPNSGYPLTISDEMSRVDDFFLSKNYPNPFNMSTLIKFALPVGGKVLLAVYDILGNPVAHLLNEHRRAGNYALPWNGDDDFDVACPSGVYLYQLIFQADNGTTFHDIKKMTLIK